MIYHVNGILEYCEPGFCVIDCAGVGYKLTVSDNTFSAICSHIGEREKLFANLQVREDGVELFGFKTNDEMQAFKLLITVSGVGPKAAMAILSLLTPDRLSQAIVAEDIKAISKANGVGAKTAARVVLELRDKVAKQYFAPTASANVGAAPVVTKGKGNLSEALDALVVLGYTRTEAQKALTGIDPKLDVEKIIPLALAKLL
ncbi:MAG: Holliday junction branch migration protein RuvA [Clostridia bacterium]|nr:Holliday junction branch migration protein RuvA [Clostridia bacterium]MBQ9704339.1 Holliday junction branch migration protein RuvA [Clostridia bacterium]